MVRIYKRTLFDRLKDSYNNQSSKIQIFILGLILVIISFILNFIKDILPNIGNGIEYIIQLLQPFFVGFIIAYLMSKIVNPLRDLLLLRLFKQPKTSNYGTIRQIKLYKRCDILGICIAYLVFTTILVAIIFNVVPQVTNMVKMTFESFSLLPTIVTDYIRDSSKQFNVEVSERSLQYIYNITQEYSVKVVDFIGNNMDRIGDIVTDIGNIFGNFLLGYIISVYVMLERDNFSKRFDDIMMCYLSNKVYMKIHIICNEASYIFDAYVKATIIDSGLVLALVWLPCMIFSVKYAFYVSIAAAILNMVPYFGALLGFVIPTFCLMFIDIKSAIIYAIIDGIVQILDGNVIKPKLMGDKVGLSAFWVIFSIVFLGSLFGTIGILFGVPIFATIMKLVGDKVDKKIKDTYNDIESEVNDNIIFENPESSNKNILNTQHNINTNKKKEYNNEKQ